MNCNGALSRNDWRSRLRQINPGASAPGRTCSWRCGDRLFQGRQISRNVSHVFPTQVHVRHLWVGIEEKERNPLGIEVGAPRDAGEWWRLRRRLLAFRDHVAVRTPAFDHHFPMTWIRAWISRKRRACLQGKCESSKGKNLPHTRSFTAACFTCRAETAGKSFTGLSDRNPHSSTRLVKNGMVISAADGSFSSEAAVVMNLFLQLQHCQRS